jgi:rRNA maturation endonuclease Nob1
MTAIAVPEVKTSEPVSLVHGTVTRGRYRCAGCGYGVSVYRSLPRCPMCGGDTWLAETRVQPLHTGPGHSSTDGPGSV